MSDFKVYKKKHQVKNVVAFSTVYKASCNLTNCKPSYDQQHNHEKQALTTTGSLFFASTVYTSSIVSKITI